MDGGEAVSSVNGGTEPEPREEHQLDNMDWGELLVLAAVGMRALEENPARLKDARVQKGARELARALGGRRATKFEGGMGLNDVADLVKDVNPDMDEAWKGARTGPTRGQWEDYGNGRWTMRTEWRGQKWRDSQKQGHPYGQRGWYGARHGW